MALLSCLCCSVHKKEEAPLQISNSERETEPYVRKTYATNVYPSVSLVVIKTHSQVRVLLQALVDFPDFPQQVGVSSE